MSDTWDYLDLHGRDDRSRVHIIDTSNLTIAQYQEAATRTLLDAPEVPVEGRDIMLIWNALGLAGEAGELAELVFDYPHEKGKIADELGDAEHFNGRLWDLYKTVWAELEEDVADGLKITHPRAFTKSMYQVLNQRAGRDTSKGPAGGLTRQQVLQVFQNEGLVEVKEVEGTGKHDFFWTETGKPVGKKLPRDLIDKHILSKSSV